jgi:hypothetical protein
MVAGMYVVAIVRLGTTIEAEAAALAAGLGTLAYSERVKLNVGVPAIVLESADRARAVGLAEELRGRGHDAVVCDTDEVVSSGEMPRLRHFRFEPGALVRVGEGSETAVPWGDIVALLRATHREVTTDVKVVSERKFAPGRAILTGGLSISKTKQREVETRTDTTEPVLYVFHRHGPPWLLAQYHANYSALGARVQPTALASFGATVEYLRAHASNARFDDRLLQRRTTIDDLDRLAHILAHSLAPAW